MIPRMLAAALIGGAFALVSTGAFACGQDVKDVQAMIPAAMLGAKAEADAKAALDKATELCTQGKADEAKPFIDYARLVANIG